MRLLRQWLGHDRKVHIRVAASLASRGGAENDDPEDAVGERGASQPGREGAKEFWIRRSNVARCLPPFHVLGTCRFPRVSLASLYQRIPPIATSYAGPDSGTRESP